MKAELRWMVRREHVRPARLGERAQTTAWAVTPYMARGHGGVLIGALAPTYFASRTAATAYARREMRRHYHRSTR